MWSLTEQTLEALIRISVNKSFFNRNVSWHESYHIQYMHLINVGSNFIWNYHIHIWFDRLVGRWNHWNDFCFFLEQPEIVVTCFATFLSVYFYFIYLFKKKFCFWTNMSWMLFTKNFFTILPRKDIYSDNFCPIG